MRQHYIITYDLRSQDMDYSGLITKIKSFMSWSHPLERVWGVYTEKTAKDIFNILKPYINDSTDRLLILKVSEISEDSIQGWLGAIFWNWLANTTLPGYDNGIASK